MSKLIKFGVASEETKQRQFHSVQIDGQKKLDSDLMLYRATDTNPNLVKVQDND